LKINWKYFSLLFALFAVLGYYRERFFVSLNQILYQKFYERPPDQHMDNFTNFLQAYSYRQLYFLKYPFTLVSILLFAFLSVLTVKLVLNSKKTIKTVVYSYLILVTLAGLSMLYGYFINQRLQDDEYTLSRWLVGIAQSPVIAIVIIASHKLISAKTDT